MIVELIAELSHEQTCCLRFIDVYGETKFNRMQVPVLLHELEKAVASCTNEDAKSHGMQLLQIIRKHENAAQVYVTFIGKSS